MNVAASEQLFDSARRGSRWEDRYIRLYTVLQAYSGQLNSRDIVEVARLQGEIARAKKAESDAQGEVRAAVATWAKTRTTLEALRKEEDVARVQAALNKWSGAEARLQQLHALREFRERPYSVPRMLLQQWNLNNQFLGPDSTSEMDLFVRELILGRLSDALSAFTQTLESAIANAASSQEAIRTALKWLETQLPRLDSCQASDRPTTHEMKEILWPQWPSASAHAGSEPTDVNLRLHQDPFYLPPGLRSLQANGSKHNATGTEDKYDATLKQEVENARNGTCPAFYERVGACCFFTGNALGGVVKKVKKDRTCELGHLLPPAQTFETVKPFLDAWYGGDTAKFEGSDRATRDVVQVEADTLQSARDIVGCSGVNLWDMLCVQPTDSIAGGSRCRNFRVRDRLSSHTIFAKQRNIGCASFIVGGVQLMLAQLAKTLAEAYNQQHALHMTGGAPMAESRQIEDIAEITHKYAAAVAEGNRSQMNVHWDLREALLQDTKAARRPLHDVDLLSATAARAIAALGLPLAPASSISLLAQHWCRVFWWFHAGHWTRVFYQRWAIWCRRLSGVLETLFRQDKGRRSADIQEFAMAHVGTLVFALGDMSPFEGCFTEVLSLDTAIRASWTGCVSQQEHTVLMNLSAQVLAMVETCGLVPVLFHATAGYIFSVPALEVPQSVASLFMATVGRTLSRADA